MPQHCSLVISLFAEGPKEVCMAIRNYIVSVAMFPCVLGNHQLGDDAIANPFVTRKTSLQNSIQQNASFEVMAILKCNILHIYYSLWKQLKDALPCSIIYIYWALQMLRHCLEHTVLCFPWKSAVGPTCLFPGPWSLVLPLGLCQPPELNWQSSGCSLMWWSYGTHSCREEGGWEEEGGEKHITSGFSSCSSQ